MMDQLLYLLGSLAGVSALVGFCVFLFGRAVAQLDATSAEASLCSDVPGFRMGEFALAADGRSALAQDVRDGSLYLVTVRGADLVTRKLARGYVKAASRNGAALNLRFSDFTFPKAAIAFADENAARLWEARLA